jgi:hypothetical protein
LPSEDLQRAIALSGVVPTTASIRQNALAYSIQVNNLGCTPSVPAAVLEDWLKPAHRPAGKRDCQRDELIHDDPADCRDDLIGAFEARIEFLRVRRQ